MIDRIKKWVEIWDKAELPLKKIKRSELQAPDYYSRNRHVINALLQYAFEHSETRLTSGLVEQQRIFKKVREKNTY